MLLQEMTWPEVGGLSRDTPVLARSRRWSSTGGTCRCSPTACCSARSSAASARAIGGPRAVRAAHVAGQLATTTSTSPAPCPPARASTSTCSTTWSRTSSRTASGGSCSSTATAATSCRASRPSSRSGSGTASASDLLLLFATYWDPRRRPPRPRPDLMQTQMGHACEWETSMMLRLAPHLVRDHTEAEPVAVRHGVRAGVPRLDHEGPHACPATSATRTTRPPRRARPCSRPSPPTWSRCSNGVIAWDGKSWEMP